MQSIRETVNPKPPPSLRCYLYMYAQQVCHQHLLGLPLRLRMDEMNRMPYDHGHLDLHVKRTCMQTEA